MNAVVAEADIDEPAFTIEVHDQPKMIVGRTPLGCRRFPNLASNTVNPEANLGQQRSKASVEFETPPAAMVIDDLAKRCLNVDAYSTTMKRMQILERHMNHVCELQLSQQIKSGRADRLSEANPSQIMIHCKHARPVSHSTKSCELAWARRQFRRVGLVAKPAGRKLVGTKVSHGDEWNV